MTAKIKFNTSGQVVLVFQGGGALGAYQAGVFEAIEEAGIEPDWVVGTSIGAINAALIAGNKPADRLERLREFWRRIELPESPLFPLMGGLESQFSNWTGMLTGVSGFFSPNPYALMGPGIAVGIDKAACYSTETLRNTLEDLIAWSMIDDEQTRLSVGAVNVVSGRLHYFDSNEEPVHLDHIMGSAALPPAFPAIQVNGDWYWDGGIYSNTPIEAVLDAEPRRDALIFAVNLWHLSGSLPSSLWQVGDRLKDIQFASRAEHHIEDERKMHRLRYVISSLADYLPPEKRDEKTVQKLLSWGCKTRIDLVRLYAPRVQGEDQSKDFDFTTQGIKARWQAGYEHTREMLKGSPWKHPADPMQGIHFHDGPGAPD